MSSKLCRRHVSSCRPIIQNDTSVPTRSDFHFGALSDTPAVASSVCDDSAPMTFYFDNISLETDTETRSDNGATSPNPDTSFDIPVLGKKVFHSTDTCYNFDEEQFHDGFSDGESTSSQEEDCYGEDPISFLGSFLGIHSDPDFVGDTSSVQNQHDGLDDLILSLGDPFELGSFLDYTNEEDNTSSFRLDCISPHEVSLLYIFMKFGVPAQLYDIFMNWASIASEDGFNFADATKHRTTIRRLMSESHAPAFCQCKEMHLQVGQLPSVTVRGYSFTKNVARLLQTPSLMEDSLWNYVESDMWGDLNTGLWWRNAETNLRLKLERYNIPHPEKHYLCPVILFDDATHLDRNGRLQAQPVLCSIGNICLHKRKTPEAWFFFGLLPKKPGTTAEMKKSSKGRGLRADLLELYHQSLYFILQELISVQHDDSYGSGRKFYVHGKGEVYLHFELAFIIGDTSGHDSMCGHYKAYSKPGQRPIRSCDVPPENMDDPDHVCKPVIQDEIRDLLETCIDNIQNRNLVTLSRAQARVISQHLVLPVYFMVSMGGSKYGIFGATPFELLHTWQLGMMKKSIRSLFNHTVLVHSIDKKTKSTSVHKKIIFNEEEFERRIRKLSLCSKRQSDRLMPRSVFNSGVTTLSGIEAQEYAGLSLLTIIALPGMLNDITLERKYMKLLWMGLSINYLMCRDEVPKSDGPHTLMKIRRYLHLFKEIVGPQRDIYSAVGLQFPKFHGPLHFVSQSEMFGSARNYDGTYLESALKTFIKMPGRRTRKTHNEFHGDIINRWSEYQTVCHFMENLDIEGCESVSSSSGSERHQSVISKNHPNDKMSLSRSAFSYIRDGSRRNIWYTYYNSNRHSEIFHPKYKWPDSYSVVVRSFLKEIKDADQVFCHYECRVPTSNVRRNNRDIFRCSPNYRGNEWFDWCMVQYEMGVENQGGVRVYSVPSRVMLWLSYETQLSGDREVYALVHTFDKYETPRYRDMPAFRGDVLHDKPFIVHFDKIKGVAYVLPGIPPTATVERLAADTVLCDDDSRNNYYISIPEQVQWGELGWDD